MIYIYILSMLITDFNSKFGINITSGVKINITDILGGFLLLKYIVIKRYTLKKVYLSSKILRTFIYLVIFMVFMLGPGLLSGAELSNSIRVIRNVLLIISTIIIVKVECRNWSLNKIMKLIYFCMVVVITNSFYLFFVKNQEYSNYVTYRTNAYLAIFLFIFILAYNPEIITIRYAIFKIILSIGLIMVAFISQERLQLVGIAVGIIIAIFNWIYSFFLSHKLNGKKMLKNIFMVGFMLALLFVAIPNLLMVPTVSHYLNFYMTNRVSIIYSNSSFMFDSSLSTRAEQVKEIIKNTNLINIWIGNGLCSPYYLDNIKWYVADALFAWFYKDMGVIGIILLVSIIYKSMKSAFQVSISVRLKKSIIASYFGLIFYILCTPNMILSIFDAMSLGLIIAIIELIKNFKKQEYI